MELREEGVLSSHQAQLRAEHRGLPHRSCAVRMEGFRAHRERVIAPQRKHGVREGFPVTPCGFVPEHAVSPRPPAALLPVLWDSRHPSALWSWRPSGCAFQAHSPRLTEIGRAS